MTPNQILALFRACSQEDIPSRQGIMILCVLYHATATHREIIAHTGLKEGSARTVTSSLLADGLIETDDDFRRAITQDGKDLIDSLCDCVGANACALAQPAKTSTEETDV